MHPIGTPVRFTHFLRREEQVPTDFRPPTVKAWRACAIGGERGTRWYAPLSYGPDTTGLTHVPGVIVGVRNLSNGTVQYNGEDGTDYRGTKHFDAYLVAWHSRRSIVRVLPEHLEVLDV